MSNIRYTTVDRVLAKFHRDMKGTDIQESDAIEWIGEALDFIKVYNTQEEAVLFAEVKNHEISLPTGFQSVLQVARNNDWTLEETCVNPLIVEAENEAIVEENDCGCEDVMCYKPNWDMAMTFTTWEINSYRVNKFTPVRLANHTFFNSIVCKEKDQTPYRNCVDEYTVVGTIEKKLRFSFSEGYVALAYLRSVMDTETGYPLVPDDISAITAITYYMKWKIAEWYRWSGREGFAVEAAEAKAEWLKYCKQSKSKNKMPKTLDEYQNLLEQSHNMIPRNRRYYGFMGSLGREDSRRYGDPNDRNEVTHHRHG